MYEGKRVAVVGSAASAIQLVQIWDKRDPQILPHQWSATQISYSHISDKKIPDFYYTCKCLFTWPLKL